MVENIFTIIEAVVKIVSIVAKTIDSMTGGAGWMTGFLDMHE